MIKKQRLLLVMMLLPMIVSANDSGICGDGVSFTFVDGTKTLTIRGTGKMYDYEPNESVPWQEYKDFITNIVIESGVTNIGNRAFEFCNNLNSVIIGNSVVSVGSYAFHDCRMLSSVTIGDCVVSIGEGAFAHCIGLKSITIPNNVISVGLGSFSLCGLTSLTIPKSLTIIEKGAFSGNSDLASIIVNEDNPVYDSRDNCNAIIESSTNTLIYGCKNTIIPNSITTIGNNAFQDNKGIVSLVIPDNVTYIGDYAFWYCTGLLSVTLGNGVATIGNNAFGYCTSLSSISMGKGIRNIGQLAFRDCYFLNAVYIPDIETWCNVDFEYYEQKEEGGGWLYYDSYWSNPLSYAHHLFINGKEVKDLVIPNTIETIKNAAFYNCSGLTSVEFGNNIKSIGHRAFMGCDGLTFVEFGNSVVNIGKSAFNYCTGLTSVIIPNSVTTIEGAAFSGCSNLTSVELGNSVKTIGFGAFSNCNVLTSVELGNSVTNIEDYAFHGCSLTSLTIPHNVTNIGHNSFSYNRMTSIVVNSDNPVYDSRDNCNALIETASNQLILGCTSTIIPSTITSIGESAFAGCDGLITVNIPDGVVSLEEMSFRACDNVIKLTLPSSMRHIRDYVFHECNSIIDVYCRAENPPTCENAFDYSVRQGTLHVLDNAIEKYKQVPQWNLFRNIVGLGESGGGGVEPEKCATPTISLLGRKLHFDCKTEGVTFHYSISAPEISDNTGNDVVVSSIYTINVYASKEGYEDSNIATKEIDIRGLKGDADENGIVDIADAVHIVNIVVGKANTLAPKHDLEETTVQTMKQLRE